MEIPAGLYRYCGRAIYLDTAVSLRDECAELNEEMILYDGLDNALVGYTSRCGEDPVAVYDYEKMISCFVLDNDWSRDDVFKSVGRSCSCLQWGFGVEFGRASGFAVG